MLSSMIQTFEELVTLHEQLVESSFRKKQTLIDRNIEGLSQLIQEESKLIKKLSKLEDERVSQVKEYLQYREIMDDDITVEQLLKIIPDREAKEQIESLAIKLQHIIQELQQSNELNEKLIQDSLDYVNSSIDLLTDQAQETINYQRPAINSNPASASTGRGFFDTKA